MFDAEKREDSLRDQNEETFLSSHQLKQRRARTNYRLRLRDCQKGGSMQQIQRERGTERMREITMEQEKQRRGREY
jgi:hypothetical protein